MLWYNHTYYTGFHRWAMWPMGPRASCFQCLIPHLLLLIQNRLSSLSWHSDCGTQSDHLALYHLTQGKISISNVRRYWLCDTIQLMFSVCSNEDLKSRKIRSFVSGSSLERKWDLHGIFCVMQTTDSNFMAFGKF